MKSKVFIDEDVQDASGRSAPSSQQSQKSGLLGKSAVERVETQSETMAFSAAEQDVEVKVD